MMAAAAVQAVSSQCPEEVSQPYVNVCVRRTGTGIAIGITVAVLLIAGFIGFWWYRKRKQQSAYTPMLDYRVNLLTVSESNLDAHSLRLALQQSVFGDSGYAGDDLSTSLAGELVVVFSCQLILMCSCIACRLTLYSSYSAIRPDAAAWLERTRHS